ncbi:ATP-binding cassette, subfamily C, LapB [Cohaesibacter sp. ES.047]|uniref:peptidase domain-containing ABC transporter n=1 Tax=Cohaesibacter sp. ES.047 TaxID=1798205 RepID=UPI000BB7491D|nr:ATP-binding cassette domain-containing protein [Cohaesibacter sp. ES.047]SNY90139.1 ATP-binding cassette, subfamily C, LapB [Cohaesibacter sp. ES.047]
MSEKDPGSQSPDDNGQSEFIRKLQSGGISLKELSRYSAERNFATSADEVKPVRKAEVASDPNVQAFETDQVAERAQPDAEQEIQFSAEDIQFDAAPSDLLSKGAAAGTEAQGPAFTDFETLIGVKERWSGIDYHSSAGRCLQVLLALLGWGGDGRHLAQALPHFNTIHDMNGLRAVLSRLNFAAIAGETRLASLSNEKLPCLFEDQNGTVRILLSVNHGEGTVTCFNGATGAEEDISCLDRTETIYLINSIDLAHQTRFVQSFGWVTHAATAFRRLFLSLFVINFGINLAALAVPIFIMAVYGYAIPSKAPGSLVMFIAGVGLIIAADYALRRLRTRVLAYIGARFDTALSVEIFQRLLFMSYGMVQNATIGAQLSRLRQFEKLREIFLGSLGTAVLDLPFVFVFIIAIAMIGGWIAAIPAVLLAGYFILAAFSIPVAKRQTMQSGDAKTKKQNIMMELFLMHRDIRNTGAEQIWQERFERAAASFAALDFRAQHFSQKIQIISQSMSMTAGLTTLSVGTLMVMAGDLGVGGLIAIMALIWRVLSPLQNAFLSLSRVGKLIEAVRMVNNLMRMQPERTPGAVPSISRKFSGHISTKNLSFRYPQASDAAIKNANVVINPGELVAITGPSGGGKSTFLKLLAGLYRPVAGVVGFDHLDIRQMDLGELRAEISYQPDHPTFFYGTVEQNFHLNDPKTMRNEMQALMTHFNITEDHPDLPDGALDTRLKAETVHQMADSLKQKLLLCRSFSKHASYYFLDEPANYLDFETDRKFMAHLATLKGRATTLFTTQRPSHMKEADRIIVLHEGQVILNGPPEQVLPQLDSFNKAVA